MIINPETGEAEEVIVYIIDPAHSLPKEPHRRRQQQQQEMGGQRENQWVENRIESPLNQTGMRRLKRSVVLSKEKGTVPPFDFSKASDEVRLFKRFFL